MSRQNEPIVTVSIRPAAQAAGLTLSEIQRRTLFPLSLCRRYWHGTRTGTRRGPWLTAVSMHALGRFAAVIGVSPRAFIFVGPPPDDPDDGNTQIGAGLRDTRAGGQDTEA